MFVTSKWLSPVVREQAGVINVEPRHGETYFAQAKALALS